MYDLRNRLQSVTADSVTTTYKYDPAGNRVGRQVGTGTPTVYLVDPMNLTGYSQILEAWAGGSTPAMTYTLGGDVIAQAAGTDVRFLIYDGHGSVRNHANSTGTLEWFDILDKVYNSDPGQTTNDTKLLSYDAWGQECNGLSGDGLYYTGEMYDQKLSMYNLRARWYSPATGRFNAVDPYTGSSYDPQSLHKYLYCHADPVNAVDPTGRFSIAEVSVNMAIQSIAMKIIAPFVKPVESIFAQGLIKGLLPEDIFEQISNARLSAVMFGGSLSGIAAKGIAVGFGGGVEAVIKGWPPRFGIFGYSEWIVGMTRANSGVMAVAKAGLIFNMNQFKDYEGNFRSITFPYRVLPKRVRQQIMNRLTKTPWEIMTMPKVSEYQAMIQNFHEKAKILPKLIDGSTQLTIFYTPGNQGPFGISISKTYLPGNTGLVAFGMQYYKMLAGKPED